MKNISLHAPLNNTNRNWERALIKKANSGGSSTPQKGVYSIELHSVHIDEYIQPIEEYTGTEIEPELITHLEVPNVSVYHIFTQGNQAAGYAILHEFNDLKVILEVQSNNTIYQSTVNAEDSDEDHFTITMGKYNNTLNSYTSSFVYVNDGDLLDAIAGCERALIRYAFNIKS